MLLNGPVNSSAQALVQSLWMVRLMSVADDHASTSVHEDVDHATWRHSNGLYVNGISAGSRCFLKLDIFIE